MVGHQISHSNIKTKRPRSANVQRVRAVVEGVVRRKNACTRCLRSGKVQKAV
jgi:large subunit ribosomal protein L28